MHSENMRQSWSTVKTEENKRKNPPKNQTKRKSLINVFKSRPQAEVLK